MEIIVFAAICIVGYIVYKHFFGDDNDELCANSSLEGMAYDSWLKRVNALKKSCVEMTDFFVYKDEFDDWLSSYYRELECDFRLNICTDLKSAEKNEVLRVLKKISAQKKLKKITQSTSQYIEIKSMCDRLEAADKSDHNILANSRKLLLKVENDCYPDKLMQLSLFYGEDLEDMIDKLKTLSN